MDGSGRGHCPDWPLDDSALDVTARTCDGNVYRFFAPPFFAVFLAARFFPRLRTRLSTALSLLRSLDVRFVAKALGMLIVSPPTLTGTDEASRAAPLDARRG